MSLRPTPIARMLTPSVIIGTGCLLASGAFGQTVTLNPSRDNTLYESSAGQENSNALGSYLFAGMTATTELRRALLQFSLASIPAGATITSVELRIFVDRGFPSTEPFTLHRVTSDWGQGTSDAGDPGGRGVAATPGDPTWTYSHFSSTEWDNRGGDFVSTPSGQVVMGASGAQYTFVSTTAMVADVQGWLADPSQNFGWAMLGDEVLPGAAIRLHSSEGVSPPVLTVTYITAPACGTSDFNGDGDFGTDADIEAFFACLAGNCCGICFAGGADFNMDGDTGTDADIEAFFRVLAGSPC